MFAQSKLVAHAGLGLPEMNLVKLYPSITYQSIIGFGAALTEAAGYVFSTMDSELQEQFLDLCFGTEGNRYSLGRLSIQSSDFSLIPRSYMNARSERLEGFSIDDDWAYVLPLVKAAQETNPSLEFLASPWSPPAWAKTNRTMKYGGRLRQRDYRLWARMIAQMLAAYRDLDIRIGRITVQNEPHATQTWESCLYTAEQEGAFLHQHLKPALRAEGLSYVKTLIWDHNKEGALDRAIEILGNAEWAHDVDGIAFHWYSGDHFDALRAVRDLIGDSRELIFTEGCDSFSNGDKSRELPHAEHYAHEIIGDLEAGANAILDWNILLDDQGGPNHVGNFCDAPLMYDRAAGTLRVRLPFHYIGHFSKFVQPGARRILTSSYTTDLETCAFANPDGSFALVVLNRTGSAIDFDIAWPSNQRSKIEAKRAVRCSAPPHSIQTICW